MSKHKGRIQKMIIFLAIIVFAIGCLLITREVIAANTRSKHAINSQNGIDTMEYVDIGGIKQAIHIRSNDINNPVLLFLHGGPGYTEMPVSYLFQDNWEDYFTVVQWDQRLSGKTYFQNNDKSFDNDGIDLRVSDVEELTNYLLKRYNKEKIVLLGHSWGSVLGINSIKKHPELYSVYIGVGQVVNFFEGEKVGYDKTIELVNIANVEKDLNSLKELAPYPSDGSNKYYDDFGVNMMKLRALQGKYGIGMPTSFHENMQIVLSPYYSLKDLTYYTTDIFKTNKAILQYLIEEYDIRSLGLDYKVPTIFIMGENDWTTPTFMFEEVFPNIEAPTKELFIVKYAGHNTMVDNQEDFLNILVNDVYPLAKQPHN